MVTSFFSELIDTLWNVNKFLVLNQQFPTHELIDTLWNVNTIASGTVMPPRAELIDTLWNVNERPIPLGNLRIYLN